MEFAGALYHVTARGDAREDIYRAHGDRRLFLGGVHGRWNGTVHAYCLMTNQYYLPVETPDANLSNGRIGVPRGHTASRRKSRCRSGRRSVAARAPLPRRPELRR
jgi:hypothetical protein